MINEYLDINPEVEAALVRGEPVVALESTIIAHGMPYPKNVETALRVHRVIRENGAVPATVGIVGGRIKVGLTDEQIEYLGKADDVVKVSRRDLPFVLARGGDGATTVAATMIVAAMTGIRVFVTDGIGGVHRGASESFDISADLEEMKNSDVVVVCAGVKSMLDIGKTLEYLETAGIPVVGYGTREFPAFYSRRSGFRNEYSLDTPEEIARMIRLKFALGLKGGVLVACPIPEEDEIPLEKIESIIQLALDECETKGIRGKRVNPFVLDRVHQLSGGESLEASIRLVLNNAMLGARIAAAR